jgi:hypothetical protein
LGDDWFVPVYPLHWHVELQMIEQKKRKKKKKKDIVVLRGFSVEEIINEKLT